MMGAEWRMENQEWRREKKHTPLFWLFVFAFAFSFLISHFVLLTSVLYADDTATLSAVCDTAGVVHFADRAARRHAELEKINVIRDITDFCLRNEQIVWSVMKKNLSAFSRDTQERVEQQRLCPEFSYLLRDILNTQFRLNQKDSRATLRIEVVQVKALRVLHARLLLCWDGKPTLVIDPTYGQFDDAYRERIFCAPYDPADASVQSMDAYLETIIPVRPFRERLLDFVRRSFFLYAATQKGMDYDERAAFFYVFAEKIAAGDVLSLLDNTYEQCLTRTFADARRAVERAEEAYRAHVSDEAPCNQTAPIFGLDLDSYVRAAQGIINRFCVVTEHAGFAILDEDSSVYVNCALTMLLENIIKHGYSGEHTAIVYRVFADPEGDAVVVELWGRGDMPFPEDFIVPGKTYSFLEPPWRLKGEAPIAARGTFSGQGMGIGNFMMACESFADNYWGHYNNPITITWTAHPRRFVATDSRGHDHLTRIRVPLKRKQPMVSFTRAGRDSAEEVIPAGEETISRAA